jgi:hypothetical protein
MLPPGVGKAADKTELDRVLAGNEYDRDCFRCRLGHQCNVLSARGDHHDVAANQMGRKCRELVALIFGESVNDRHVLSLDIAALLEALAEPPQTVRYSVRRPAIEKPNDRHRLLRPRH